jgi:hypothetical protein
MTNSQFIAAHLTTGRPAKQFRFGNNLAETFPVTS